MIDIHSHIMPGIDDGAPDMVTSLAMLKKAEKAGITDIILTPHYMKGTIYNASNAKKWQIFNELVKEAKRNGIGVNLYLGNEIYIDNKLPEMLAGYIGETSDEMYEVSTLNSTKYVLVEFPVRIADKTAKNMLFTLVQKGFVPVIAHPERYHYVQDNLEILDDFIGMGCVLQGEYLTMAGKYGKRAEKTLKKLLFDDKIFCLASDVHKFSDEYQTELVQKKLMKILGDEVKLRELTIDNPRKIIQGK
ncbi:hypothetical protein IJG78_03100 [Candidatus Saccharibacteria bacterium]|nr:hypothetical protein [Candidatus Saccharibacteria bacterium]